jgi:hypothetical protein
MKIVSIILLLLSGLSSAQFMCPSPTYMIGNSCCFDYNGNYSIDMMRLTNSCTTPYKHIEDTCCIKFGQIIFKRTSSMDENGRSVISIRSPFDDSTIRTEQSLDLNYNPNIRTVGYSSRPRNSDYDRNISIRSTVCYNMDIEGQR